MNKNAKKPKYYVVWKGRNPGIYHSWTACQAEIKGFSQALYKSYSSLSEAQEAFSDIENAPKRVASKSKLSPKNNLENPPDYRHDTILHIPLEVTADAWAVDAACSGNPGPMEYQAIDLATGAQIFHFGPIQATNNIGEFLAIVHALALLQKNNLHKTIYSDSKIAISWVKQKTCKSKLPQTAKYKPIFDIIARAEAYLHNNPITQPILKWDTEKWGEIPADFGRK